MAHLWEESSIPFIVGSALEPISQKRGGEVIYLPTSIPYLIFLAGSRLDTYSYLRGIEQYTSQHLGHQNNNKSSIGQIGE
jgi:hypothetical protein